MKIQGFSAGFLAGIAITSITATFMYFRSGPPAVEGKTAPAIANVPTETIPIQSVKVYVPAAKKKLDLPTEIQLNLSDHVTAATTVTCKEEGRDKTVTSIINDDGKSTLFVKQEPLPWFRPEEAFGLTLDWGQKRTSEVSMLRAGVRLDLAQTKALHFGITGSVDGDRDWFYGVGVRITIR